MQPKRRKRSGFLAKPTGDGRATTCRLDIERLEDRRLLAVDFQLLKDINSTFNADSSNPQNLTVVGDVVFFTAETATLGTELWKTDGTAAGTLLVKDIYVGSRSANPWVTDSSWRPTNVNGVHFFIANDGVNGAELWKSDGTTAGTTLVKDIRAGLSSTFDDGSPNPQFVNVGGLLYFTANDGVHGMELWKSDGTDAGTVMVKDIFTGNYGAIPTNPGRQSQLVEMNGVLFFNAQSAGSGYEIWRSDGTSAGTKLVHDIYAGGSSTPLHLTNVNGKLFFSAYDPLGGREVWVTTGVGAARVKDITPGSNVSSPQPRVNVAGTLYFTANDGVNGSELWKSDGTAAGTVLVKNILPGAASPFNGSAKKTQFAAVGSTLFFTINDGASGYELWKSDGSAAGTVLVKDIAPGALSAAPNQLVNLNGVLLFQANDGVNGYEMWRSDGSAAGTVLIQDVLPGAGDSLYALDPHYYPELAAQVVVRNGVAFFAPTDGIRGRELWRTDGTAAGTSIVRDIVAGTIDSTPEGMTKAGNYLYFTANDGVHGTELWRSDGSELGTQLVIDASAGPDGSLPKILFAAGETIVFQTGGYNSPVNTWKVNGTTVEPIPFLQGASGVNVRIGGVTYFPANDGASGWELWKIDGHGDVTLVKDILPGENGAGPSNLTVVNDTLFFFANDGVHGAELWKSDGTAEGTTLVRDIRPGYDGSLQAEWVDKFANVGGTLYFSVNDGTSGEELWKSDGTAAGTVRIMDLASGSDGSFPGHFTAVGETIFFTAYLPAYGNELWRTDGTAGGTRLVKNIGDGTSQYGRSAFPIFLHNVNGTLFFRATNTANGIELWRSDGTEAGTILVKDINPGRQSGLGSDLVNVDGTLYFSAYDGVTGADFWTSDGTEQGTAIVGLTSIPGNNGPLEIVQIEDRLFVSLAFEEIGREIWVGRLTPKDPGDFNVDSTVDGADFLKWQREFGQENAPPGTGADASENGLIDASDLEVWMTRFGSPLAEPVAVTATQQSSPAAATYAEASDAAYELLENAWQLPATEATRFYSAHIHVPLVPLTTQSDRQTRSEDCLLSETGAESPPRASAAKARMHGHDYSFLEHDCALSPSPSAANPPLSGNVVRNASFDDELAILTGPLGESVGRVELD